MNDWLRNLMERTLGMIAALRDYSRRQRLFLYSILITVFVIGYMVALPRYDCAHGVKAACAYVEHTYQTMMSTKGE